MKTSTRLTALTLPLIALSATAAEPISVTVEGIKNGKAIPQKYALCKPTKDGKSTGADNIRPTIRWSGAPNDTQSFAIIVHDTDVPQQFDNAGKEGKVVAEDAPRRDAFYHWALVDIPADIRQVSKGRESMVIGFGQAAKNDLGDYMPDPRNYGGPCPPWNDQRIHHYHFTVYALDVASLKLKENATAKEAATAIRKHTLAQGEVVGTYTLNAELRK